MKQLSVDEQAVFDVIEAAHRAFWMKDVPTFERHHLASDDHVRWVFWQPGGMSLRQGWSEIGPRSIAHMSRLRRPLPEFAEAPVANLRIRVTSEMAWANFDRLFPHVPDIFGQGPNGTLHQVCILERHEGAWKIACNCLYDAHLGDDLLVEVAADGRIAWASEPARAWLADDNLFVVRGGRLRLRDQRLDGRLRTAIRAAGSSNDQLMPERRAVPLVVEGRDGIVSTIWVLAEGGRSYVMLDDRRPIDARLAQAALVYDLSPAQVRLAQDICTGVSLPDFARDTGISPNTARTHLRRMFDKVGVSSQTALVRALLSLTPPR